MEVGFAGDARQKLAGVGRLQDADGAVAHALSQAGVEGDALVEFGGVLVDGCEERGISEMPGTTGSM